MIWLVCFLLSFVPVFDISFTAFTLTQSGGSFVTLNCWLIMRVSRHGTHLACIAVWITNLLELQKCVEKHGSKLNNTFLFMHFLNYLPREYNSPLTMTSCMIWRKWALQGKCVIQQSRLQKTIHGKMQNV